MLTTTSRRRPRGALVALALVGAALLLAGCGGSATQTGADPRAVSQGFLAGAPGPCANTDINAAFHLAIGRPPAGDGNTGECWPNYYGGGPPWPSDQYLLQAVINSKVCSDPWLGQALQEANRRFAVPMDLPLAGEAGRGGLCNHMLYNSGVWATYPALVEHVKVAVGALIDKGVALNQNGSAVWNGRLYPPVQVAILEGPTNEVTLARSPESLGKGANKVAVATTNKGGAIIAVGGGNIVAVGGGNVKTIVKTVPAN